MSNTYQNEDITFADCKFKREPYANTIIDLVSNSNTLTENNSFVIALDSPWGTGKSTFIRMLKNKINAINRINGRAENIHTVVYNAWDNDYCETPFEPLFYDIISNDIFEEMVDRNNVVNLRKSALKILEALGKDFFTKSAAYVVGKETYEAFIEMTIKAKDYLTWSIPTIKALEEQRRVFREFGDCLAKTAQLSENKKLFIIIDELDRCKPIFAIRTLEIIKHLFNIPNIVFLLAVDFNQLRHSIATVYGEKMDSTGYLRRFANYTMRLPEPSKDGYIDYLANNYRLKEQGSLQPDFINDIKKIFGILDNLSIRDINSIYENFRMFFISRFTKTKNLRLSLPYLALMILKYKDIELYNSILQFPYRGANEKRDFIFIKIKEITNSDILSIVKSMEEYWGPTKYMINDNGELENNNYRSTIAHSKLGALVDGQANLLFDDIKRCLEMEASHLTPSRYMARQIEMFTYRTDDNQAS